MKPDGKDELCLKCGQWNHKRGRCKRGNFGCHTYRYHREGRLSLEHAVELRKRYVQFYAELNEFLKSEQNRKFFGSKEGKEILMRPKEEIDELLQKYLTDPEKGEGS